MARSGPYIPSIIPEEDAAALRKMWQGEIKGRWGLGEKPAVLVIDMTRAFVEDRYPSGWAKTGEPCAQSIRRLLDVARPAGFPVFYTRGEPHLVECERGAWLRGRQLDLNGPTQRPEAHEIVDIIAPQPGEPVITKAKPSGFFGTQLQSMLTYLRVDTVIVTGMVTSGCIRATVNDAFSLNYRVVVPIECSADRSQVSHEVELFDMGSKYADVMPLDELIEDIRARQPLAAART